MVRLDMSEYMEKHTVSRLIGAPPGYVGYEEGGQLTEAVKRRPYSLVLLDEIEKAHPDVFNVLLQILDDGRLTDGQGRTVDFKNTVIIMTSNLGSQVIKELSRRLREDGTGGPGDPGRPFQAGVPQPRRRGHHLQAAVQGRHPRIVDLQLELLRKRLGGEEDRARASPEAKALLAERGYDPVYGARPLKRSSSATSRTPWP